MIEVAGHRRDHPVLAEQPPNRLHVDVLFVFQANQIAHFVIAVSDVNHEALVAHFAVGDRQLARIGVHDLQPVAVVVVLRQRFLLIGTLAGVFRLDKADVLSAAADGLQGGRRLPG